jgi:hypothetical protein
MLDKDIVELHARQQPQKDAAGTTTATQSTCRVQLVNMG